MSLKELKLLIKNLTGFKNYDKPTFNGLILINQSQSFQLSPMIQTGVQEGIFYCCEDMKIYFQKQKPNIIMYQDYRNSKIEQFEKNFSKKHLKKRFTYNWKQKVFLIKETLLTENIPQISKQFL